ncbi:hypothetical protein BJV78DRAFT_1359780 [Lactifluus subvellereus]|nr:hypothetical protein BJV78DRAFT_1359780 [Lactifluus subvellereus]
MARGGGVMEQRFPALEDFDRAFLSPTSGPPPHASTQPPLHGNASPRHWRLCTSNFSKTPPRPRLVLCYGAARAAPCAAAAARPPPRQSPTAPVRGTCPAHSNSIHRAATTYLDSIRHLVVVIVVSCCAAGPHGQPRASQLQPDSRADGALPPQFVVCAPLTSTLYTAPPPPTSTAHDASDAQAAPRADSVGMPVPSPILAKAQAGLDVAANFMQASLQFWSSTTAETRHGGDE